MKPIIRIKKGRKIIYYHKEVKGKKATTTQQTILQRITSQTLQVDHYKINRAKA